jgi:hypothetical protein
MEFLRNLLNTSGETSYFTYMLLLFLFILTVMGAVALMDYMFGKVFGNQED